ncbi:MAG TPA: YdcF family protein [Rhodospirillaceae bacterium]|nr:YdcF family protein [Rhodospirillaceae bacterium]
MRRRRDTLSLLPWTLPLLLIGAAWLAGLVWFAASLPDQVEDQTTPTDAIVVLTGGTERLGTGLDLLRRRIAGKLFVSGVYRGLDVAELLRLSRQKPDEVECCIVLGHVADNTQGNAIETAAWMRAEGFHSLRLVTANYHMRRSLMEFRFAMPDVTIVAHPVFPDTVKRDQWWMWPGTAHLLASEYTKFLAARIRQLAESLDEPGR